MTEVIDYVREDGIQAERTAGMFQMVNDNHTQKVKAEEQNRLEGQARIREIEARIREIEAEEAARRERFWMLVHTAVGTIVMLAGLAYLHSLGAMHDALAVAFALITTFGAGKIVGELHRED